MLPKKNRLRQKKDFEKVFKKGQGFKENFLVLKKAKNNLDHSRFGFIVSQKISKKANIRNKIKRKLREIIKTKIKLIKSGNDIVIVTLPGIGKKSFQEIREIMIKLFKKAKLI